MPSSPVLTAIDLFSGSGGVTTGYKAAGLRILAAVDLDSKSRATFAANHPDVPLFDDDLLQLNPQTLLERVGLKSGTLDILTACAPCQTFSSLARKNRKKVDPRNQLVERIADFAETLAPRAVVMENVPPLLKDPRFLRLVKRLRIIGYGVRFEVLDAAEFGVPQRRRRLVMIAIRGVTDEAVPMLDSKNPHLSRFCVNRTVRDAFRSLRLKSRNDTLSQPRRNLPTIVAQRIAAIPRNGGSRASLPETLKLHCHKALYGIRHTEAGNVYGRMILDEVAPTLTTRCVTPACGRYVHPCENRPITLREAAVLQTFPVNYRFEGGTMAIQAQIGNAVPPRLAEAIAVLVSETLNRISLD